MGKNKISIRLTDNQMLVLDELKDKLNSSYSLMIRAIVGDFLSRNEDAIERICSGSNNINNDDDYACN